VAEYRNPHLTVDCSGQVATIRQRLPQDRTPAETAEAAQVPTFLALANLLDQLRADDDIRVIVLHRGDQNLSTTSRYLSKEWRQHHNEPVNIWRTFSGIIRMHEVMASIEKPIVCQVNGNLIGGQCNVALACDLIVAREDVTFADHHLGMGRWQPDGPPFGLVPGDGGVALAPLYFTPPLAKEFLMLGKGFTAKELAARGLINYAVSAEQIDAVVADLVQQLLKRPAYPLAWAKRVANRHVIDQLNRTLDAGAGYEMIGLAQLERQGWVDKTSLH
jgi:enoyl-CoA hydratase/carnithine racemase